MTNTESKKLKIRNSEQLKSLREFLNMTQRQMAEWLDVSYDTYRGWEGGRKDAQGLHIYLIALPNDVLSLFQPENASK